MLKSIQDTQKKIIASIRDRDGVITKVFILCHSNVSLENGKKEQLKSRDTTKVDSAVRKILKFISVVPLPEATTVSLLFSCSYSSEVLGVLCSTGTSIGI